MPDTRLLWRAYAFAPAVAPVLYSVGTFLIGMIFLALNPNDTGTPIGVIVIPMLAMTAGMISSYLVAGMIGMPIAFYLRNRNRLNGYTIHAAAIGWCVILVILLTIGLILQSKSRPAIGELLVWSLMTFAMLTPCVLLSATTFWWIVCKTRSLP